MNSRLGEPLNKNEIYALKIFALLGLLISIVVNVYLVYGPFTGLVNRGNTFHIKLIIGVTILVQMLSAILAAVGFARVMIMSKGNMLFSIPAGALVGAVAAGLSFGLTMATMFIIAVPLKAITFSIVGMNAWPWWKIFGSIFINASIFGAAAGIPLGAMGVLVLIWILKHKIDY